MKPKMKKGKIKATWTVEKTPLIKDVWKKGKKDSLIAEELMEKAEVVMTFTDLMVIFASVLRPLHNRMKKLEDEVAELSKSVRRKK